MSFLSIKQYGFSFLYTLATALSVVLIQDIEGLAISTSLFISTLMATIFFHIVSGKSIIAAYTAIYNHKILWLKNSLYIFIVWFCTFYATQNLGSAEFILVFFIVRAIIGYGYEIIYKGEQIVLHILALLGMLCLLVSNVVLAYRYQQNHQIFLLNILISCLGGVFSFLYNQSSYQFAKVAHMSALQILAVRFYILLAVLAGLVDYSSLGFAIRNYSLQLGLITLLSFVIPLYFNQRGLAALGPAKHMIIVACTPFLTGILNLLYAKTFSTAQFIISILVVFCIFLSSFYKQLTVYFTKIRSAN